jgi:predicted O-methyltransferase YrrM
VRRAASTRWLLGLPPRVAWFYCRAVRTARRKGHAWALEAATQPPDLKVLIELARGARTVVELGTGPAWTAIALAIAEPGRRVISYDPVVHEHRGEYLRLAPGDVADRLEFVQAPGSSPRSPTQEVDLLFIDSLHERDATVAEFNAWRSHLRPGAAVVFHDYGHPQFPGVAEAVCELGLEGDVRGGMFVWRAPEP